MHEFFVDISSLLFVSRL